MHRAFQHTYAEPYINRAVVPINDGDDIGEKGEIIKKIIMDKDLRWNSHVESITKKACKKLYSL